MDELDPRLAADTVEVLRWPLCRVLLMNDANWPWLILVPARSGIEEIFDLSASDRALLMEEAAQAGAVLKVLTGAGKINIAALGNVVRQLHVHVIARFADDPAGTAPVWGAAPRKPYAAEAQAALLARLRAALAGVRF